LRNAIPAVIPLVLLASCSGDTEERKNCYSITADDTNHDFRDIWNFASGKIVTFLLSVLLVDALKNSADRVINLFYV